VNSEVNMIRLFNGIKFRNQSLIINHKEEKMRKMITAVCVLTVAAGSLMAAANILKVEQNRTIGMINDRDAALNYDRYENGFTQSAPFNQSPNGAGWYQGYNRKIAWMPDNNLYVSVYSEKSGSGTGSIGGMAGNWTDGNNCTTISSSSAALSGRYPATAGIEKYGFGIFNSSTTTPVTAYISVYNKDEEGWTVPIQVKAANGSTPPKAWCGIGDVTKDAGGNYHLLTSWEWNGLNNANAGKKIALSVGKSPTPYITSSWSWTDYKILADSATADVTKQFIELDRFAVAWGKNGFGIAMTFGKENEEAMTALYYTYTKDYGQTWVKTAENKLFKGDYQFPFVGKSYASEAGDVLIEEAFLFHNVDLFVDENNDVHMLVKACVGTNNGQNLQLGIAEATDGTQVGGHYLLTAKFDAQGNPEGYAWGTDYIARYVGFAETDNAPLGADGLPVYFDYKYSNGLTLSMSYFGNGTIAASWLDRSETDAMLVETAASEIGVNWTNPQTKFMMDPYIIFSTDYGKTWQYSNIELRRANHIKVNADQKVQEDGFSISSGLHENGTYELYAAYQIANYQAPVTPVDGLTSYEQNLHVLRVYLGMDIETEDVTNGRTIELAQNYPNPFNPTTAINFNLQTPANVKLSVFNAQGQEVANLINAKMVSGAHTANFNAANLNSGVYFYKLSVDGQSAVKKMVLTK